MINESPCTFFVHSLFALFLLFYLLASFRRKNIYFAYKKPISCRNFFVKLKFFLFLKFPSSIKKKFNLIFFTFFNKNFSHVPNFPYIPDHLKHFRVWVKYNQKGKQKRDFNKTRNIFPPFFPSALTQFLVLFNVDDKHTKKKWKAKFSTASHEVYKKKERQSIQSKSLTLFQQDDSFVHFVSNEYIDRLFFMPLSLASAIAETFFYIKLKRTKNPRKFYIYFIFSVVYCRKRIQHSREEKNVNQQK